MYTHLLVPLDNTPLATLLIDRSVAYAKACGARVTFFHACRDLASSSDGALLHAMSPEVFEAVASGNAHALLAKARMAARAKGVDSDSMMTVCDHPDVAILDASGKQGCDLIFMASHGRRGVKGVLLGSMTRKLLEQTRIGVLIAAVESNLAPEGDEQRVQSMIRDEHRSLGAVLDALLQLLEHDGAAAEPALLAAMLGYVEQFPQRLHHPKEEQYLFSALRGRTPECDAVLDELERQHHAATRRFDAMRGFAARNAWNEFAAEVRGFAQEQFAHMGMEENLLLPMASRHLTAGDWKTIAAAFHAHDDPLLGAEQSFERVASRLLQLALR